MKSTPSGQVVKECKCEFVWLIELFLPGETTESGVDVEGNSLGWYIEKIEKDGVSYRTTKDAWAAKRFTKEEAQAAVKPLLSKLGVWKAIEHGFCQ